MASSTGSIAWNIDIVYIFMYNNSYHWNSLCFNQDTTQQSGGSWWKTTRYTAVLITYKILQKTEVDKENTNNWKKIYI